MAVVDKDGNEIALTPAQEEARKRSFEQLQKKALLVKMTRKQFANFPLDLVITKKVAKSLGISNPNFIQVRKFLINPAHLKDIRSLLNDAQLMLNNYTRPWDNKQYRLLPMELWDDLNETFGKIVDDFEEAVQVFENNWDDYKAESKKNLGEAWNSRDFPDKSALKDCFKLAISTAKFQDIDDPRLHLTGDDILSYERSALAKYEDTIKEAQSEMYKTLKDLEDDINSGKGSAKTLRSLNVIDKLNLENDENISTKIAALKDALGDVDEELEDDVDTEDDSTKENESMMLIDDDDLDDLSEFDIE